MPGPLHGHAQLVGQAVGGHAVDDGEVDCLADAALFVGDFVFGDAQRSGGGLHMQVDIAVAEGGQQARVLAEVGQHPEFASGDTSASMSTQPGEASTAGTHGGRQPLQVRVSATISARNRTQRIKVGVDPAVRLYLAKQGGGVAASRAIACLQAPPACRY